MSKQVNIIAHQVELVVNNEEESALKQQCGAARVAYNHGLKIWRFLGKPVKGKKGNVDEYLRPRFNAIKFNEYPWMER